LLYLISTELTYTSISGWFRLTVGIDLPSRTPQPPQKIEIILFMVRNILIVEDDEDLRAIVVEQLRGRAVHAFEASNGQAALQMIATQPIALVITDIDMPIKNGLELLDDIQRLYSHIPVLIMTGGNYSEKSVLEAGAKAFIRKPFILDVWSLIQKFSVAA
jgi:CheY-like chemotaxis protein